MRTALRHPVVRRVALVQVLVDVQFWFPLWLIFLLDQGIGLGTALIADGVFRMVTLASELPVGRLADRIGRRRAVLLVCLGNAVVFLLIAFVQGALSLFLVWIAWGVVWALSTGIVSSYLFEACRSHAIDPRGAFAVVRGSGSVGVLASLALAGYLYSVSPTVPFLLTSAMALAAGAVAWGLPELARSDEPVRGARSQLLSLWRDDSVVRHAWVSLAALVAIGWSVRILFQPLSLDLEMSVAATGWFYAVFAAAGFAGHISTAWVSPGLRARTAVACTSLLSLACILSGAAPQAAPWLFLPAMGLTYALGTSLLEIAVHERVPDAVRGTALAAAAAAAGLVIAVARPGLGWVSELASVAASFFLWGGLGAVVVVVLLIRDPQRTSPGVRDGSGGPSPTVLP